MTPLKMPSRWKQRLLLSALAVLGSEAVWVGVSYFPKWLAALLASALGYLIVYLLEENW